jgi:predicted lipoprotein
MKTRSPLDVPCPLLALALLGGCVHVETSYRDAAPTDLGTHEASTDDAPPSDDTSPAIGAEATRAVLASIGERVILADLAEFEARAAALEEATLAASTGGAAELDAARAAWRRAMEVWQRLEMVQLGPAGLITVTLGGRGLRDEIDGWPLSSRCGIDQRTVSTVHGDAAALGTDRVDVRGLTAIEYLLFVGGTENGCGATAEINASGSWEALGEAEVRRRRAVYAHTAARVVHDRAVALRDAWAPAGDNFLGALSTAGAGSPVYASAQQGLNAISDALVYLYREVADYKLGIPAGLRLECTAEVCPEQVESRWAGASLDHVRANLVGFQSAYLGAPVGTDAPGFDDLLRSIGAAALDARIQAEIAASFAALDAVEGTLEAAVLTDHADVVALHDSLRTLADSFRVELVSLLDLQPSIRIEGDND